MPADEDLRRDLAAMTVRMAEERTRDREILRALERENAELRQELNRQHDWIEEVSRSRGDLERRVVEAEAALDRLGRAYNLRQPFVRSA